MGTLRHDKEQNPKVEGRSGKGRLRLGILKFSVGMLMEVHSSLETKPQRPYGHHLPYWYPGQLAIHHQAF